MKRYSFKVLSAFLSALILLSTSMYSFVAADINDSEIYENQLDAVTLEQKKFCNATINDNFEDDSVLVIFDNKKSMELNNYDKNDFDDLDVKSVKDLTSNIVNDIKDACTEKAQVVKNLLNVRRASLDTIFISDDRIDSITNNVYNETKNNYDSFHQIVEIKLNENSKQNVLDVIEELEKRDDILVAEPNYIIEVDSSSVTPNDTYLNEQWAVDKIDLTSAWDITTGSDDVSVGIIDSGIKAAHSDLSANVDSSLSKSFIDDSPLTDELGHGTHVSGIIGAVGNNNHGVTGVCWNVNLVSLKIFDSDGNGSVGDLASAINYAQSNDIDILNFSGSFGVDRDYQVNCETLKEAINNYDGIFVCSAGNQAIDIDGSEWPSMGKRYPAVYTNDSIIAVAATDRDDELWYQSSYNGSSYGSTSVDLAAPGLSIYSTYNGNTSDLYYTTLTGTSMASPYVTGVAALIKSEYPGISAFGIKKAILDSVDEVSDLSGKVKTGGRLNAYNALVAVENCTYTVEYNKNGGYGTEMSDTTVIYGISTELRDNTYIAPTGKVFSGWYAYRHSDDKWYYTGADGTGWYKEGSQPAGFVKNLYKDQATVAHTSSVNDDIVTMYAQWIDKSSILIGDVNLDGVINISDVLMIQKYVVGMCEFDDVQKYAADVNGDGYVNTTDATELQKLIV